ncbi:MAG: sulfatase [Candidatus Brocadiae bacterium]|nr:sulfatase [Candidatus Brocadiia bacterium]
MAKPNVVLVTADALRPDHLGCYGYAKDTSPALDALAQSAFLFENVWATGPSTPFSFPGLMASRMPFESTSFGVGGAALTLAELLRAAGYRTQGFHAANPYISHYFGYDRGFDQVVDFLEYKPVSDIGFRYLETDERVGSRQKAPGALHGRVRQGVRRALQTAPALWRIKKPLAAAWRWASDRLSYCDHIRIKLELESKFAPTVLRWVTKNRDEPSFLWVHPMTVHEPYAPPEACQLAVNGRRLPRWRVNKLRRTVAVPNQVEAGRIGEQDVEDMVALYDAEIRRLDNFLARLLAALQEPGWWTSSIIIVTADHGEQLFEHGRFFHPSLHYNEVLKVPLIIRLPGGQGACRISQQVGLIDLMPTLAELLDLELPEGSCRGKSFASLLSGRGQAWRQSRLYVSESFCGRNDTFYRVDGRDLRGVARRISFQNLSVKLLVDCSTGKCQAFDLRKDPAEENDLAPARPELAQIAKRLARLHIRSCERVRVRRAFPCAPMPTESSEVAPQ